MTSNSALEISIVVQNIFEECDVNGEGNVRVTDLIEYMAPYMTENESQLHNIRMLLDPHSIDGKVTSEQFLRSMNKWVEKYNQHESLRDLNQTSSSLNSHLSMREGNATANISDDIDKSALEDQIHQLTFENKNIYHELDIVKAQLLNQEEQIESLQTEKSNLMKKLSQERELNESLVEQNDSFDENSELNLAKQKQIDKLEKELAQSGKTVAELRKRIDSYEHQNQKHDVKLVAMHEKLAKYRSEVYDLTTAMQLKNDQIKYFEETKEMMHLKIKDLELKLVNIGETNKCLVIEKNKISKTLQQVMNKQNILPRKTTIKPEIVVKDETTQTTQTPPPRKSTSPVPFPSPINTTKFKFFNIDSPVAKRCLQQEQEQQQSENEDSANNSQEAESQTDSPITPIRRMSLPYMHVIEYSGERNATVKQEELNLSVSGTEEELLQLQIGAITQSHRKSLMDEMVEYQESMKLTCDTCNELCAKIERSKVENAAFQKALSDCKELLENKNSLEASNQLLTTANAELTRTLQQRDEEIRLKCDQEDIAQRRLEEEVGKLNKLNAAHDALQELFAQLQSKATSLAQDVQILSEEKHIHETTISTLNNTLEGKQQQLDEIQEENNQARTEYDEEIEKYRQEVEKSRNDIELLQKKCKDSIDLAELRLNDNEELQAKYKDVVKQKNIKNAPAHKMPHDKAQLKIEKLMEKKEYLEEVVHLNNIKIDGLKRNVERLETSLKELSDERSNLRQKCDNCETQLESLHNDYEQLSKCAAVFVENIFKMRLKMTDMVEQCNVDSQMTQSLKIDHDKFFKKEAGEQNSFFEALQCAGRDLDVIITLLDLISRHCLPPTCITIKDRRLDLSRSISPDSPNLEEVQTFVKDDDEDMNMDGAFFEDPLASIESFYHDSSLEESLELSNLDENDRDVALQELVLTIMIDYYGNRQRLKNQLIGIRRDIEQLSSELRSIVLVANARRKNEILTNISKSIHALFEAIESYGALKEEVKMSNKVNLLMSHITQLHEENETLKKEKQGQKSASTQCDNGKHSKQLVLFSRPAPSHRGVKSFVANVILRPIGLLVFGLGLLMLLVSPNTIFPLGDHSHLPFCWMNFWESLELLLSPALSSTPI